MALADSYARHTRAPVPAPASGIKPSPIPGGASPGIGLSPPARPQNRAQNTAMQYQRAQIETASPTRLIIMLHEGAIRFCQVALDAMTRKDLNAQHVNLLKAQRIIAHLLASLNHDKGGDVAKSLSALYPPLHDRLVNANRYDQPQAVREVQDTLRSLCESWLEVERLVSGSEEYQEQGGMAQRSPSPLALPDVSGSALKHLSPSLSQASSGRSPSPQSAAPSSAPQASQSVSRLGSCNA